MIAGALPGEGGGDMRIAKEIDDYAEGRPDVHVKTGYGGVGNVELNALQRVARAGISLRLRPGLTADRLETWWKGTPVVDEDDDEAIAARIEELVRDPGLAVELGAAGRERVRDRHLITHALEDELRLAGSLLGTVAAVKVLLPDDTALELSEGATGEDAARAIGEGLARAALAVKVDGELRDLGRPLHDGARIEIVTQKSPEALELIRHDAAHVLATAVRELYPGTKISIGPPIENGFYYDFEFPDGVKVSEDDFERIEQKMREHVKAAEPFEREDVPAQDALKRFLEEGEDYKVELIEDLMKGGEETVSLYRNGPFTDLCRGPHAPTTKTVKAFKLESVAGAYWRGDSDRQMLTRIYGTAFFSKEDLAEHLERLEQARARDHRKLGRSSTSSSSASSRPARRSGSRPAWRSGTS